MIATLLLAAAPVVQLGDGSGVVLPHGIVITTHRISFATARPVATLEDGGTVAIERAFIDDPERDLALLVIDGELPEPAAVLSRSLPDAGDRFTVATLGAQYAAEVRAVNDGTLEVEVADAGEVGGAALLGADGQVWGMMRDSHRGIASSVIADGIDALTKPKGSDSFARYRNLGISAAFFLGLAVWWVYRSRARRY